MRARVVLKIATSSEEAGGGGNTFYELGGTFWAKAEQVTSARRLEDSQIQLQESMRFTLRQRDVPQITKSDLLEYRDKDYTVNAIRVIEERDRYIEVIGVTDGFPPKPVITT